MMNENSTQSKRDREHEEQSYDHNDKRLCQEQAPSYQSFWTPFVQSSNPLETQESQEADASSFVDSSHIRSPHSPDILNSLRQSPARESDYYNELWLNPQTFNSQPGSITPSITEQFGFQPTLSSETHLTLSERPGVDQSFGLRRAELSQIWRDFDVTQDVPSQSEFEFEQIYGEVEISSCPDTGFSLSQPNRLATPSETDPGNQPGGLRIDTCFGVIVTQPTISQSCAFESPAPVDLRPSGNLFKIHYESTGKYVGLLAMPAFQALLALYKVEFKAFVLANKSDKIPTKGKKGKSNSQTASEYALRIVVFGCSEEKTSIGKFLSSSDLYLQHPLRTECDGGIEYFNPHYLVRTEGGMPKIEDLSLFGDAEDSISSTTIDDVTRSRILRIFDYADGLETNLDVNPSSRLQAHLMKHQLKALGWMIEKESNRLDNLIFPSIWIPDHSRPGLYRHTVTSIATEEPTTTGGGIIADEMGLGKTLSMLALICSRLDSDENINTEDSSPRTTLIVTPKSTLYGWQQQIERHIQPSRVTLLVYHGSSRQRLSSQIHNVDIVLTTYETLRSDFALEGPLYSQRWLRLVLDEAHHIRNQGSQIFAACCRIHALYRWCLTGTPVQNSLYDFGALLSFLRIYPFQDKIQFDYWIVNPFQKLEHNALGTLRRLVGATCLRRTKANCDLAKPLPPKSEEVEDVRLLPGDRAIYDFLKRKIQRIVNPNFQEHDKYPTKQPKVVDILSIITSLRVVCDHVELLPQSAIDAWQREDTNMSDQEAKLLLTSSSNEYMDSDEAKRSQTSRAIMAEASPESISQPQSSSGETGTYCTRSAKINALLQKLHQQPANSKSVVFSSWTKMLNKVEQALVTNCFNYRRIDGQSGLKSREEAIKAFGENSHCTVMLASIGSAGEGVDFTAAQYVHILEPHWNPMAEAQAVDRVHRIGQKMPVTVTRYIVPHSIETYVRWVQNDKLRLINLSLDTIQNAADIEGKRMERLKDFLR
ncbi:hypothetical protein F5Y03DRAFT_376457 [Xylaria venustula]|nr:hypothetical protein F5Y03DRAFT_376457 [Xylaria venustula]